MLKTRIDVITSRYQEFEYNNVVILVAFSLEY